MDVIQACSKIPATNQCLDCEAGRFSSERDSPGCMDCPRGFHGVEITLTKTRIECIGCPRGTFGDTKAMQNVSMCKDCEAGRYSDVDALPSAGPTIVPCKECPRGRWSDIPGVQESGGARIVIRKVAAVTRSWSTCTKCSAAAFCYYGPFRPQGRRVFLVSQLGGSGVLFSVRTWSVPRSVRAVKLSALSYQPVCRDRNDQVPYSPSRDQHLEDKALLFARLALPELASVSSCPSGKYRTGDDPDGTRCKSCLQDSIKVKKPQPIAWAAGQYGDRTASTNCTRCPSKDCVRKEHQVLTL